MTAIPTVVPQTVNGDNNVFINDTFECTLTFSNTGTLNAFAPFYDVFLPPGLSFASDSDIKYIGYYSEENASWLNSSSNTIDTHPNSADMPSAMSDSMKWYTIHIPYSSYNPSQPDLDITKTVILSEADGAVINTPLTYYARAHFELGYDALDNSIDPVITGDISSHTVTPIIMKVTKSNDAPESEIATGPNFSFTYTIDIEFAEDQEFTSFVLSDTLNDTQIYVDGSIVLPPEFTLVSVTNINGTNQIKLPQYQGDTLELNYTGSVTSSGSNKKLTISYDVYVPYTDSNSALILSETTGNSRAIGTLASVTGTYLSNETSQTVSDTDSDTVTAKSIAIQKSNNVNNYAIPLDVITYTLNVQISDYFAYTNIEINDILSDGQSYKNDYQPTYTLNSNGQVTTNSINSTVTSIANSKTNIHFDISSISSLLHGGYIALGSDGISAGNSGKTTIVIMYQSTINTEYNKGYAYPEIDIGDYVTNTVHISGLVYDHHNQISYNNSQSDGSVSRVDIGNVTLDKTLYAVNGSTTLPERVFPGDSVTYRLLINLSHQNVQDFTVTDYLPPPILKIDQFNTIIESTQGTTPWTVSYGNNHDYEKAPVVTVYGTTNSIVFDFGTYQTTDISSRTIELFYTAVCNDSAVKDGLRMTNQAHLQMNSTLNVSTEKIDSVNVIVGEPKMVIFKNVVSVTSTNGSVKPTLSLDFGTPGDNGGVVSTINSTVVSDSIDGTKYYGNKLQGDDYIRYAMIVLNKGSYKPYNVTITDTLPSGLTYQTNSLRVLDGNGVTKGYSGDIFGSGMVIDNDVITAEDDGTNMVVITFDVQIDHDILLSDLTNYSHITNYASMNGGENFVKTSLFDTAEIKSDKPSVSKVITSTSETHTTYTDNTTCDATIGEVLGLEYTINLPIGKVNTLTLNDILDDYYQISNVSLQVDSNVSSSIVLDGDYSNSIFTLGNVTNNGSTSETIQITCDARLKDVNTVTRSIVLDDSVKLKYVDSNGNRTINGTGIDVTVVEPNVVIDKYVLSYPTNETDYVEYRIDVTNTGTNTSKAFNLVITDLLDNIFTNLTLVSASPTVISSTTYPNIIMNISELDVNETAYFTYRVTLDNVALYTTVENTASVVSQSISSENHREYSDSYLSRCYVGHPTITKSVNSNDTTYSIGQTVPYAIKLRFQQNTTETVSVKEIVPDGLSLINSSLQVITAGTGPNGENFNGTISSNPTYDSTNKIWTFGNVTVNRDEDLDTDYVELRFNMRVVNQASNVDGVTLTNTASLTYVNGTSITINGNSVDMTVVEPVLSMTLNRTDEHILANTSPYYNELYDGQVVIYTVNIDHSNVSSAKAYQVKLTSTLPDNVTLLSHTSTKGINSDNSDSNTIDIKYNNIGTSNDTTLTFNIKYDKGTDALRTNKRLDMKLTWKSVNNGYARDGTSGDYNEQRVQLDDYGRSDLYDVMIVSSSSVEYSGTIMVEDIIIKRSDIPLRHGDFDFNDIVGEYWIKEYVDDDNHLRAIVGEVVLLQQRAAYDHDFALILPGLSNTTGRLGIQRFNGTTKEALVSESIENINERVELFQGVRAYLRRENDYMYDKPSSAKFMLGFDTLDVVITGEPPYYPHVNCYIARLSDGNPTHVVQYRDDVYVPKKDVPQVLILKDKHDMWTCVESTPLDEALPYFRDWIDQGQDINDQWYLLDPIEGKYEPSITDDSNNVRLGTEWKTRVYDV